MMDAVKKIKRVALKLTQPDDWTDQQGKPYLEGSGSEKIALPFGISWTLINDPQPEFEEDGHFTYTYRARFTMGNRTIEVDGSRSSRDGFFKKYDYSTDESGKTKKTEKGVSAIIKRDVKMSAFTNLLGNGITRILGIRNLTWADLKEFSGITQEQVKAIQYAKDGKKPPLQEPQKKANGQQKPPEETAVITSPILKTELVQYFKKDKEGKPTKEKGQFYRVWVTDTNGNEASLSTFHESLFKEAKAEEGTGMFMKLGWKPGKIEGTKELLSVGRIEPTEERQPGQEG
jgi:hypothetical protein